MKIDEEEIRYKRIEFLLGNVRFMPYLDELDEITFGRNPIYINAAIDLYINDYREDDDFSKEYCMGIIMQASKGQINPDIVKAHITNRWIIVR